MYEAGTIYNYNFPTNIKFGVGAANELKHYLKKQGLSRPLVVTDPLVSELSFLKALVDGLNQHGLRANIFNDIHKNPIKSDVLKGNEAYFEYKSDCVIGIGGGAAMDVARAIVLSINHHADLFEYDDQIGGSELITEPVPHFITIPTTAGTGSEVGRAAVISEDESKRKRILFHPKLLARMVFVDPQLTYDLPAPIAAATGMDALTHNLEAYLSKGFHPICDGIALEGVSLIYASLEKAVNNSDQESRANMLIASLMGAVAFQKGLGIVHSMSHPLSTLLDMHHGLANAINLPHGLRYNIPGREDRFKVLAKTMNLPKEDGEAVVNALFELNERVNLPTHLGSQGVTQQHIEPLSELAVKDFCLPDNHRPAAKQDFIDLYSEAL